MLEKVVKKIREPKLLRILGLALGAVVAAAATAVLIKTQLPDTEELLALEFVDDSIVE